MGTQGLSGDALLRAADAMLRSLGGDTVSLVFPLVAMPDDPSAQLGLVDPGTEEVTFSPVIVRNLPTSNTGPRRRLEISLSGSAVADEIVARNVASADALFDGALGVMHNGGLLHIEGITTEYFAGTAYLYKVVAVE
jgi:hypothetical protein